MGKTYIGIDPGLAGGVAALSADGGLIMREPMPTMKFDRRNSTNVCVVRNMFLLIDRPVVIIESAQKFSAGTNALTSTWFGYGRLTALLELDSIPFHVVASPRTWQKEFWTRPKLPKGQKFDTKEASINAAKRLFPGELFLPTSRCKKPSDGITDAVLLAEYGRRRGL
jgi:hypothetical protein